MKKKVLVACIMATLALSGCSESAESLNSKGMTFYSENEYEKAIDKFKAARKKDGENPAYMANLGRAYMAIEEYELAAEEFEKALKNDAKDSEELEYLLAKCYFECEKYDEGIEACEKFINEDYKNYENYFTAYDLLMSYDLVKTAESLLQQAVNLKAVDGDTYNSKGMVYYYIGDYEQALSYFEKARENGCNDAILNVAKIKVLLEEYSVALSVYEYYENAVGKTAWVSSQKSYLYLITGDYNNAVAAAEEGLSLECEDVKQILMYNRIVAYEKCMDYNKAYEYAQIYIQMYPDDEAGRIEYEFLKTRKTETAN